MSQEAIAAYLQARKDMDRPRTRMFEIVQAIHEGSRLMNKWREIGLANSPIGLPVMGRESFDVSTWPTGEEIAHALAAYHEAVGKVRSAWAGVSANDQRDLQPPETCL